MGISILLFFIQSLTLTWWFYYVIPIHNKSTGSSYDAWKILGGVFYIYIYIYIYIHAKKFQRIFYCLIIFSKFPLENYKKAYHKNMQNVLVITLSETDIRQHDIPMFGEKCLYLPTPCTVCLFICPCRQRENCTWNLCHILHKVGSNLGSILLKD